MAGRSVKSPRLLEVGLGSRATDFGSGYRYRFRVVVGAKLRKDMHTKNLSLRAMMMLTEEKS